MDFVPEPAGHGKPVRETSDSWLTPEPPGSGTRSSTARPCQRTVSHRRNESVGVKTLPLLPSDVAVRGNRQISQPLERRGRQPVLREAPAPVARCVAGYVHPGLASQVEEVLQ